MRVLAFLLAFLCWASTCFAAIGTPAAIGASSNPATANSVVVRTTADCPIGSEIVVISGVSTAVNITGAADSSGNTWSNGTQITTGSIHLEWSRTPVTTDLPGPVTPTGSITTTVVTFTTDPGTLVVNQAITGTGVTAGTLITGGISQWNGTVASATVNNSQTVVSEALTVSSTITVSFSGTSGTKLVITSCTSGITSHDAQGAGAGGTSTAPTITTGTLGGSTGIVFGVTYVTSGSGDTYTQSSGFAAVTSVTSTQKMYLDYHQSASNAAVTYAPTLGTSRAWGVNYDIFLGAAAGASGSGAGLLLGVP